MPAAPAAAAAAPAAAAAADADAAVDAGQSADDAWTPASRLREESSEDELEDGYRSDLRVARVGGGWKGCSWGDSVLVPGPV